MNSAIILFVTVFAGLFCVNEAIRCYACSYNTVTDSIGTPDCDEGSKFRANNGTVKIEECNGKCQKIRGGGDTKLKVITRSCSTACLPASGGGQGSYCCETDLCNTAWRMTGTTAVTVLAAIVSVIVWFIRD